MNDKTKAMIKISVEALQEVIALIEDGHFTRAEMRHLLAMLRTFREDAE